MRNQLFAIQATDHESTKLRRLLKQATKQDEGAQKRLNTYTATLFKRYGQIDPESYQISIITNLIVVEDYPSFDEIVAAMQVEKGGANG